MNVVRQHLLCSKWMIVGNARLINYLQGQSPSPNVREYFYFIDHHGMLFLDDAKMKNFTSCFKEKKFLVFFFNRLKVNNSGRFAEEFPFLSPCGVERNFVRCDDKPIVFTHVMKSDDGEDSQQLCYGLGYGHAGDALTFPFNPEHICTLPETGRVYHPAPEKVGGVGLIKSSLAIEFSKLFQFENGDGKPPTHFNWKNNTYKLSNMLIPVLKSVNAKSIVVPC